MLLDRPMNPDLLNRHKQVNLRTENSVPLKGVNVYNLLRLSPALLDFVSAFRRQLW